MRRFSVIRSPTLFGGAGVGVAAAAGGALCQHCGVGGAGVAGATAGRAEVAPPRGRAEVASLRGGGRPGGVATGVGRGLAGLVC
ncbi:MAG: hypothetical protein JO345_26965 [Streptosporangiaceae bacterium]|nr:hypothetical protein [Streptosporangiaceae bacterium]